MKHTRSSFHLNETHAEEESPPDDENVTYLKHNTPILFSTNRGIHLRVASTTTAVTPKATSLTPTNTTSMFTKNSTYSMIFCDLERWSTNRANTISLEDTFTIPKPAVVSSSLASNSIRFLTHKSSSIHLNDDSKLEGE